VPSAAFQSVSPLTEDTPRGPATTLSHLAPADTANTPLVHEKVALPVVGATVSVTARSDPEIVSTALALQALVPTVQFNAVAAQSNGAAVTQVDEVAGLQLPFVQRNLATPVVGPATSCKDALAPDVAASADALHALAPTVQVKFVEGQSASTAAQVAAVGPVHTPLLHA
jgi:hypothetical protein